ncbi:precorrin-6y C5,15-methyltransferase subunit CbiE [Desulfolithobacter dissulfuricans]|uniref:Precorrin-6y C5,15-methyltransferase subunit CbiE n=1 Tax=Desulfolithobacter dissulfuricans TaxID=2795293 RepID=A0A915U400_9BACT|nr:precorrin-6y C5,15-methyltransferase subunit CbiE [Desulfolithobacter dissulfuricans]
MKTDDMSMIELIGVSGNVLDDGVRETIARCHAVVASGRHVPLVEDLCERIIPIAPVQTMLERLAGELALGPVTVLASGDPLFFGIGRTLLGRFGPDRLHIRPALSAMQLACARFKTPWDDMAFLSLHGREMDTLAGRVLVCLRHTAHGKVMLFTDQHNSPDRIAALLLQTLEEYGAMELARTIRVQVGENLGLKDERLVEGDLARIAGLTFAPLNMMLISRESEAVFGPVLGLNEEELVHSRGLITKNEVRAVTLHTLRLPPSGVFWDVGGGSGSVSIEAARMCPALAVFCVEAKGEQQENIRANIRGHQAWNVRLVSGLAPAILSGLPDPERIFVGGSRGRLKEIIDICARRLKPGGRLVVNAVLARTAEQAPKYMLRHGLSVQVTRIGVSRWQETGEEQECVEDRQCVVDRRQPRQTTINPITIICGTK